LSSPEGRASSTFWLRDRFAEPAGSWALAAGEISFTAVRLRASFQKLPKSSIMNIAPWQVWRWIVLAEVRVQEGEPLENALRRFKRKVQQEDIIKEVKRHSYYLKPGEKRRVKAALARKRNRKKARKEQD
jgi:small subunit ribosomal protein S21